MQDARGFKTNTKDINGLFYSWFIMYDWPNSFKLLL